MEKIADIVETAEMETFAPDEIMVTDEFMPMDMVIVDEPAASKEPGDYDKTQDIGDFMSWITKKMHALPPHSGKTTAGCERVIAHLKMLDKEISKAISRDVDCKLDDQVVEKFRKEIRKMTKMLMKRHKEINEAYDADDEKYAADDSVALVKEADDAWKCPECGKLVAPGDAEHKARHNAMAHGHEANDKGPGKSWIKHPNEKFHNLIEKILEFRREEQKKGPRGEDIKNQDDVASFMKFYDNLNTIAEPVIDIINQGFEGSGLHISKVLSVKYGLEEYAKIYPESKAKQLASELDDLLKLVDIDKKASSCACQIEKTAENDNCPTCKIKLWKAAEGMYECISCEAVFERPLTKEAGTPKLTLIMTPFERAVTGAIINGFVSHGKNPEEVYAHFKEKYKFSDRDELSIQQVLADMGYPMLKDRGHIGDSSEQLNKGKGIEFATQYNA